MMTDDRNLALNETKECFICKLIVKTVRPFIGDNATVKEVEVILDAVCEMTPTYVRDKCEDFVHKYCNLFAQLIITIADEEKICCILHACENKTAVDLVAVMEINSNIVPAVGDTCQTCKIVGSMLKSILGNQDMLNVVKDVFKMVCDKLPDTFNKICNSELITHWRDYINMVNNFKAEQFCKSMNLCDAPNELTEIDEKERCDSCQIVANMVKTILLMNPDMAETIKNRILGSCGLMASEFRTVCDYVIKAYWKKLINMLETYNPYNFCVGVKMCPKKNELQTTNIGNALCTPCKMLSIIVKSILENPDIERIIKGAIGRKCAELPRWIQAYCNAELETNWAEFLNMLRHFNAGQFCRSNELCSMRTELATITSKDTCKECKTVVQLLRKVLIWRPDLVRVLKKAIINACGLFIPDHKFLCTLAVNQHWNEFISILTHSDPLSVCRQLVLCPTESDLNIVDIEINIYQSCALLHNMIKYLTENIDLTNNLRNALTNVCSRHRDNDWCNIKVKSHWQEWMHIIETISTENFCRNMKMDRAYQGLRVVAIAA